METKDEKLTRELYLLPLTHIKIVKGKYAGYCMFDVVKTDMDYALWLMWFRLIGKYTDYKTDCR